MSKVYIKTFGCQMNVRDSEVICGLLKAENCQLTASPDEADIIIFNTCSVRQHAEDKVWSEIGKYKIKNKISNSKNKTNQPANKPIIGLVGCMAQNYKEAIFERAPNVNFVVGPSDIHKIPEIIHKCTGAQVSRCAGESLFERKIYETDGALRPEEIYHTGFYEDKDHAYVVISEGCSNYCSYCVVPYVRGELHNRNYKDILREIEEAVDRGITRVTLLGQNVCAYNDRTNNLELRTQKEINFSELLRMVNDIKGLKEFSFITSHPRDASIELFRAMADCQRLKKYLHLPAQSGSDRILKLMNRGYTRRFYLDLAANYRRIVPDGALSTDIIVGFPTETKEDFRDSFELVREIQLESAFIFKYSVRPNTEAAKMVDDVSKEEKEKRHGGILELQKEISKKGKRKK